jgi:uncharacterized protein (DUF697 family)
MVLPAKAGYKKVRGLQKTLKSVRDEAGQEVSVVVYSESKIEVEILSILQPQVATSKKIGDSVFSAACRISDRAKRTDVVKSADIVLVIIAPRMTNEQIASIAVGTMGARKRLVIVLGDERDDAQAKRLAKAFGVGADEVTFIPKLEDAGFAPALISKILDSLPDKKLALAAAVPSFRSEAARHIITKTSNQNALIGFIVFMPGADMPLLTANQMRMVLQLSALYRQEVSLKRLYEIFGVAAGGFVFRGLARELIAFVPVLGWAIKGLIAYSGTVAMGRLTLKFLESRSSRELEAKP